MQVLCSIANSPTASSRYGWFSNAEPTMGIAQVPSPTARCGINMHSEDFQEGFNMDIPIRETANVELPRPAPQASHISEQPAGPSKDLSAHLSSCSRIPEPVSGVYPGESNDELPGSSELTPSSWDGEKNGDVYCREQQEVGVFKFLIILIYLDDFETLMVYIQSLMFITHVM